MQTIDWIVVFGYCAISLCMGLLLTRKASQGIESYFLSGRRLSWWLAGTSMAATAFSSDTPLLITGIIRKKGIWGNWEIWALSISTMFAVFFFSKLWKRTGVMTEVELVEVRYSGKPAAILRGFKAIYWGLLYNIFVMGAWPMTGLVKVMQETTEWNKAQSIFFCTGLTLIYSTLSGYWGVVLTDFFQFFIALAGAFLLAFYAIRACGGISAIVEQLADTDKLNFMPPIDTSSTDALLNSPFCWFLGLILIQWWAWKNTDGGGIIVQRIASCRNEKQALLATLWFNIAQYALRTWPWILTALASLILLPDLVDHERAYPRLVTMLLPAGVRGLMIASFFAAFMSTMSTHLNWGTSYIVNDFYKRFIRPNASDKHYIVIARIIPFLLAAGAMLIAFYTKSISQVFTFILNLTAAIGPVYLARWFWWRVNPWSEITAMLVSLPIILMRPIILEALGISHILIFQLLWMVLASAVFWVPITLITKPSSQACLQNFFDKVNPPGWWSQFGKSNLEWMTSLRVWIAATAALLATAIGPLMFILERRRDGLLVIGAAISLWLYTLHDSKKALA